MSVIVQRRVARRAIAAGRCDRAAAIALLGLLLVLLVATLMGGLALSNTCAPGAGTGYAPSPVALADIPGNYLQSIRQAGDRYGLDWSVIAGIYSIETDFGRLDAPGVRSGEKFAGAGGPGQFLAGTWRIRFPSQEKSTEAIMPWSLERGRRTGGRAPRRPTPHALIRGQRSAAI